MRKLVLSLMAVISLLSGCVAYEVPYRERGASHGEYDRDHEGRSDRRDYDRDGEGNSNRHDNRQNDSRHN